MTEHKHFNEPFKRYHEEKKEDTFTVKLNKEGKLFFLSDYNEGSSYFGGYYNETKKEYRFRISTHVQEMLEENIDDYGLILLANERQTTANRVVLNGPNGLNGKLRLELIYTKLY